MSDPYHIASIDDIPPGTMRRFSLPDHPAVLIANVDGQFRAVDDMCSHAHASLSAGLIVDGCVECPRHGSRFDLATGAVRSLPAVVPIKAYPVTVRGNELYIQL
jgi:3-phenylpropionate/trans-cinnamate dioxygenase ferredoxin subunit